MSLDPGRTNLLCRFLFRCYSDPSSKPLLRSTDLAISQGSRQETEFTYAKDENALKTMYLHPAKRVVLRDDRYCDDRRGACNSSE